MPSALRSFFRGIHTLVVFYAFSRIIGQILDKHPLKTMFAYTDGVFSPPTCV